MFRTSYVATVSGGVPADVCSRADWVTVRRQGIYTLFNNVGHRYPYNLTRDWWTHRWALPTAAAERRAAAVVYRQRGAGISIPCPVICDRRAALHSLYTSDKNAGAKRLKMCTGL